jgi:hypothetical protein
VEDLGLDLSTAVILIEQRQDFPALIVVSLELFLHRTQKCLRSANIARQCIQPHQNSAFTFSRTRWRPADRPCSSAHINILMSDVPKDLVT